MKAGREYPSYSSLFASDDLEIVRVVEPHRDFDAVFGQDDGKT